MNAKNQEDLDALFPAPESMIEAGYYYVNIAGEKATIRDASEPDEVILTLAADTLPASPEAIGRLIQQVRDLIFGAYREGRHDGNREARRDAERDTKDAILAALGLPSLGEFSHVHRRLERLESAAGL